MFCIPEWMYVVGAVVNGVLGSFMVVALVMERRQNGRHSKA